jgi:hypothetical protein
MRNLFNWKMFLESFNHMLTIEQENELESYLFNYFGFDRKDLDVDDISDIRKKFDPKSNEFADFLQSLDSNFDWFDYRMVPDIINIINDMIKDYWEIDYSDGEEDVFEIGDLVDFGKWGKVYVLALLDDGIKVTTERSSRFEGESADGFIIPDNDIDKFDIIERGIKPGDDEEDDEEDDWWKY